MGALSGDEITQLSHSTSPALLCSWGTNAAPDAHGDSGDTKAQGTTCCSPHADPTAGISQLLECLETPPYVTSSCEVPWCQPSSFQLLRTHSETPNTTCFHRQTIPSRMADKRSHPQTLPARRNAQLQSHHNPVHRVCQHPQLSHSHSGCAITSQKHQLPGCNLWAALHL